MNQALLLACSLEVAPLHRSCMLIHIVTHMLFRRVLGTAYTTAPAKHGPVSQCQTSSCKLNRVHAVPDNLQGFEGHDSSASHSNPTGRGYCTVKKPEGLTSRMDSHSTIYLPFFSTTVCQGTWFQDLHCCLGNEKSHNKREPQVWSFNPIADHIQQVQNLSRSERKALSEGARPFVLALQGVPAPSPPGKEATAGRTLCTFLSEMLSAFSFRSRPAPWSKRMQANTMSRKFCPSPPPPWGMGSWGLDSVHVSFLHH